MSSQPGPAPTTPSDPAARWSRDPLAFARVPDAPRSDDLRDLAALRDGLQAADFSAEGISALLGPAAVDALARDQIAPALSALDRADPASPLATVATLFTLARPVAAGDLDAALPGAGAGDSGTALLERLGLAEVAGQGGQAQVTSRVDLDVHAADDGAPLWVAADLTAMQRPGALRPDHVLGVGGASRTLAQITPRRPVASALDLGVGSGVQTFHLLRHAQRVVATDLSERALGFARFNLLLNAPALEIDPQDPAARVDLRLGSLLEPVAGERFDLVVSNPPFVITPRPPHEDPHGRYTYRDGGQPGDRLVAGLLGDLERVLEPGGTAHLLGNWEVPADPDPQAQPPERRWSRRVESWVPPHLDAWVIQRELLSPAQYAETWLRDASSQEDPAAYLQAYRAYLEDFASRDVEAVGFGWIRLRAPRPGQPAHRRFEHLPHPVIQPVAEALGRDAAVQARLDDLGEQWRELRLLVPQDVTEERHGRPGAEHPQLILLRQGGGLQRTAVLTSEAAGAVGVCDGELSVAQILAALGALLDWEDPQPADQLADQLRALLRDGFLEIA